MPLYEYRCKECTEEFVLLQSVHVRSGETICPQCGTHYVLRLFSPFATQVNGSTKEAAGSCGGACARHSCGCA